MANQEAYEVKRLEAENAELKKALAISMNQELVKKLKKALERINNGEYLSEEEFFNKSKSR